MNLRNFCCILFGPVLWAQQWSVGYWTPFGNPGVPPAAIEWGGLTHVIHAWALVQPDGTLDLTTERVSSDGPALIAEGHARGVKVLLGIGQPYWLGRTGNLPTAATSYRATLVNNIMNVVNTYGFDGVDIDWEPFDYAANGGAMRALASDLRNALGTRLLTAAVNVTDYPYWGSVAGSFDRISVMTYDLTGTWNPYSWHNAALYDPDGQVWSVDLAVRRFTANGVPAAKLSIGIPFFGWQWTGGNITGPGQHWTSTPSLAQTYYQNFASTLNQQNRRWDAAAAVPYITGTNSFLTYDDEQSVAEKVRYAKSNGLGGWIIWELSGGYMPTRTPNQPLLAAIKNAMGGGSSVVSPSITSSSPLPSAVSGTAYSATLTASGTVPITWSLISGALPQGLSLNGAGAISGTPAQAGTFTFSVQAANSAGTATKQFNLTVSSQTVLQTDPPSITTAALPGGVTGNSYNTTLTASGTTPMTWDLSSGSLPPGLSLGNSTGVIGGTPTLAGTSSFTVRAANSAGTATRQFSLTVSSPGKAKPPRITIYTLPGAIAGKPYIATLTASGTAPITWWIYSGSLPPGLSLDTATGRISGTPLRSGTFSFTVLAVNSGGSASRTYTLSVAGS